MEKSANEIFKTRTVRSCVFSGVNFFIDNIRLILKRSIPFAIVYSIILVACMYLFVDKIPEYIVAQLSEMNAGAEVVLMDRRCLAAIILLVVSGGLFEIAFYSVGFDCARRKLLDKGAEGSASRFKDSFKMFVRTLKGIVLTLLIVMPVFAGLGAIFYCLYPEEPADARIYYVILAACGLLLLMLVLPLVFVLMKYIYEDEGFFVQLRRHTVRSYRKLGYMISVLIIDLLLVGCVQALLLVPSLILCLANINSNLGLLYGDPLGLPSSMPVMSATVFFVSGIIIIYSRMIVQFTFVYMYGSVDTYLKGCVSAGKGNAPDSAM